jgi:hypothetical protein
MTLPEREKRRRYKVKDDEKAYRERWWIVGFQDWLSL